ncbi:MAG: glycosyltransferase [Solirubrobacteraceae bacterium]
MTPDVLVVSVDSTMGWSTSGRELAAALRRAGAEVELASTGPVPRVRTYMLTDLVEAWLARRAYYRASAAARAAPVIYCSVTSALLWPRPGAIWLDVMTAENRPGRHGLWQRVVERRRLEQSPLVLTMAARSLEPLGDSAPERVIVPVPVDPSGLDTGSGAVASGSVVRDIDVLTYAGNPMKRRLDFVLGTWARARRGSERMVVAGIDGDGVSAPPGVEFTGRLDPPAFRALCRRSRVLACAPTREDFGIAPLEALADGCLLVTTPAPGPYPALDLARELDPRLVADDLVAPLRFALDSPLAGYGERAAALMRPFGRDAIDRTLANDVLPRLVPRWSGR